MLRGRIGFGSATREAFRRGRVAVRSHRERSMLDELASQTARLRPEFQNLSATDLLKHFRERTAPSFFQGFELSNVTAQRNRDHFPDETGQLLESARTIANEHRWPLLGFGEQDFGREINWHRDPLSGRIWPLDYHGDIPLWHNDGSDVRVLWEFNRLGHLIPLGRAYALTGEEGFPAEFFAQVESWQEQNPVGRGANWSCAMEVALRAMNLLAAFSLCRRSSHLGEGSLFLLLTMFDQHGAHIRRNLEFTHLATSNHYLSNLAGLLWIGIMLPELEAAKEWSEWALAEMLRELDKQVLTDGADYEGSTGYHCFVLELILYSFLLCRTNGIPINDKFWHKLHLMLEYLRAILRPDGLVPLFSDTDGSQVLAITLRNANDRAHLVGTGAVAFEDSQLKVPRLEATPELLWLLGDTGLQNFEGLGHSKAPSSQSFPDAGTYVMRHDDLYLLFNANGMKDGRPASHRHNDALSIEVSACGRAFIVDPGSYVYTADLHERHRFRSTAYHSTVEVDEVEQNSIDKGLPFVIGNETQSRMLEWVPGPDVETLAAEHYGYRKLRQPVTHRRRVVFNKQKRCWFVSDELRGEGVHDLSFRFHFAPALEISVRPDGKVEACDQTSGVKLLIHAREPNTGSAHPPELEERFSSHTYGEKAPSISACWFVRTTLPFELHFTMLPIAPGDGEDERLSRVMSFDD